MILNRIRRDRLERQLNETANKACDLAFANAQAEFRTLKGGRGCFFPVVEEDETGFDIGVGINPEYHYLIYQENGFKSFTMKWAFGRVIPMMTPQGLIYRKCTNLNQWRSGNKNYWRRDSNGELYSEYKQSRSWVHPGHKPVKFIESAIEQAVYEDKSKIRRAAERLGYSGE